MKPALLISDVLQKQKRFSHAEAQFAVWCEWPWPSLSSELLLFPVANIWLIVSCVCTSVKLHFAFRSIQIRV